MEERCPKCGEPLITKTIKKELGLGSIDYPVARVCPKCNWNIDLTGAKDIKPPVMPVIEEVKKEAKKVEVKPSAIAKPPVVPAPPKAQPTAGTGGFNKLLTIGLAILVIGGLIWAFSNSAAPKQSTPTSTLSPTPTPAITATAATPVVTGTQVPEVTPTGTPTGNNTRITLDRYRIFKGASLTIRAGDEVIWYNEGSDPVTVASDDIPGFTEKVLDNGKQTLPYVFKSSGTYTYYVKNNKNVNGTIKVT